MGAPYDQDLRDRILATYDRGMKTKQIADMFQVSPAYARRVNQRRRETGETSARHMGGATVVKIDITKLEELVRRQPDATLLELRSAFGVDCTEAAVCLALQRLGYTFKKRRFMRRSNTGPTSPTNAKPGKRTNPKPTRNAWFSSMKRGPKPT